MTSFRWRRAVAAFVLGVATAFAVGACGDDGVAGSGGGSGCNKYGRYEDCGPDGGPRYCENGEWTCPPPKPPPKPAEPDPSCGLLPVCRDKDQAPTNDCYHCALSGSCYPATFECIGECHDYRACRDKCNEVATCLEECAVAMPEAKATYDSTLGDCLCKSCGPSCFGCGAR